MNEQCKKEQKQGFISIYEFDDLYNVIWDYKQLDDKCIQEFENGRTNMFIPRGMTALNYATIESVNDIDKRLKSFWTWERYIKYVQNDELENEWTTQ